MLPADLPTDLPSFQARFGTDEQCRDYLFEARWPEGFCCTGCGHVDAYRHKKRLIDECVACGKQHSLLAGTIFEQTKTGLARWFLAVYLVTSSKRGISAMELQRQMGFGSYGTAWAWLHKIRRAMVARDREPLGGRVEADETLVGGAKPGKPGRGAAGKTVAAGAVESGRARARDGGSAGCAWRRCPTPRPRASRASSAATSAARPRSRPTAGGATTASPPRATTTSRSISPSPGVTRRSGCPRSTPCSPSPNAGCSAPITAPSARSTCDGTWTSTSSASTAAPPRASAIASPA